MCYSKVIGGNMEHEEIIQQLWECLRRGYTYNEAQIHMRAFRDGKTTEKKVVVVEKGE